MGTNATTNKYTGGAAAWFLRRGLTVLEENERNWEEVVEGVDLSL